MYSLDQYEIAAIIGYWRSGASYDEISSVTGLFYWIIEKIITQYQLQTK
ncbi:MAG TPA: hypothetical protein VN722_12110 [Hanamia sp.]|nr:hypothetical protein [Hanamia sp.]